MAGAITTLPTTAVQPRRATAEAPVVKWILIGVLFVFFALFLLFPLVIVFKEAFAKGFGFFLSAFSDQYTLHAIQLTLLVAAIAVPLNTIFGMAAAWLVTKFQFRGRSLLISLIDLPLWVSPVVGGLLYVLIFGARGWLGPWLIEHNIQIIFATPGLVIATTFVTFPFVARGLIPLMQAQGHKEEEAAMTLGASPWHIFWRVTVPKVKWGLIYGIILCNARAMGEFGAVSVVSGHIRNRTNTMPLQIQALFDDYNLNAAFAVASALCVLALVTLILKTYSEWRTEQQLRASMDNLKH